MRIKEPTIFHTYIKTILLVFVIVLQASCQHQKEKVTENTDYTQMVYPLLDTENSRWFFFSSACRPFGMVNLSPDTEADGAWGSGYRYKVDTIKGFSHIHAWQLSGLSVMPLALDRLSEKDVSDNYYSPFDHDKESVAPGHHQLHLDRYDVDVELTSTKRVGFHKYTFVTEQPAILFNLSGQLGPSEIIDGSMKQIETRVLEGELVNAPTFRRPKPTSVFFRIELDTDIEDFSVSDKQGKFLLKLPSSSGEVKMKVAISYTSTENAKFNLDHELSHWNFEKVVQESKDEWNSYLSRVKVEGGTHEQQRRFYTDLWHALQGRRVISDANGYYPDNTGDDFQIKRLPITEEGLPLFNHYNSDSFWGAQWTINTLWQLVYPEIAEEFVNSLLQYYRDGGLVPRGPSGGNYTYVMTGASSTPFIVGAYQKGIRGFDAEEAYEALKRNHMPGGIMMRAGYEHLSEIGGGLENYIENGFVPYPTPGGTRRNGLHQNGGSLTLEYAYQDWCLAQFAKALGKTEDEAYFMKRSENYRNVFDAETNWMRPKNKNGKWREPYDPYELHAGFIEANGAQGTWFVPHDLSGLANLMGGNEAAVAKLNQQFEEASKLGFTSGTSHSQELHPEYSRIPINYGNQPSIQTAFVFHHLGRPDLTQYWSREVVKNVYEGLSTSRGYNGDEDQGLMGALAVLMKIGVFQMTGGSEADAVYQIASSTFDRIEIELNPDYYKGQKFIIETENNSEENKYIKTATLNGKEISTLNLDHIQVTNGGKLHLEMYEGKATDTSKNKVTKKEKE